MRHVKYWSRDFCACHYWSASQPTDAGSFRDLDTIDSFLAYLQTKTTQIDVHRYNKPINDPAYMQPEPMATSKAIGLFRDPKAGLVNLLNLGNVKDNSVPAFMQGIRAIKLLKEITKETLLSSEDNKTSMVSPYHSVWRIMQTHRQESLDCSCNSRNGYSRAPDKQVASKNLTEMSLMLLAAA